MFDHDPDMFEDETDNAIDNIVEETIKEELEDIEEEKIDNSIVEEAIIAGAVFGMGIEEGINQTKGKATDKKVVGKNERRSDAVSLKSLGKFNKEEKMRPFEQWVDDFIHGRKKLTDDL